MLKSMGGLRWTAIAAVIVMLLAGSLVARQVQAAPAPQQGATGALDPAVQSLADALLSRDYATLAATAAPEISVVRWLGDRRILPAADALDELQSELLAGAPDPYLDDTTDLEEWFGIPPTQLWQDAAVVDGVLYLRGLGADGAGELLVGIDGSSFDAPQWSALLFAAAGFGTPDARANNAAPAGATVAATAIAESFAVTAVQPAPAVSEIKLLRTVNVYPATDPDAAPIGVLRRGQTLLVLGLAADGDYFQIECPSAAASECWVVNDPAAVEAVVMAEPETTTEATPTAASTESSGAPAPAAPAVETPAAFGATIAGAATDSAERISFLPGEVTANRTGVAEPTQSTDYLLRVLAGQILTVDLISGGDVANFSVTGVSNGQPYKRVENESRNWTFIVPVTQDYLIRIVSPAPTQYSLTVVVPPLSGQPPATPTWTPQPLPTQTAAAIERISVASGATSASRGGQLGAGESKTYVIRVLRGQNVITELYSTGVLSYSIVAADATLIKRRDVGSSPFVFTAPASQDYSINILAQEALDYGLTVTVPPLEAGATATPSAPVRLSVPAGGTSVSTTDIVDAYGRDAYLARAMGGQTMYVSIQSPDDIANFSIVGVSDGQPLKRLENEDRAWSGTLPATQDYLITVANPRGVRVQYTLNVSFSPLQGNAPTATPQPSGPPQRITFAAGGTTATVSGNAPQAYVLRALAGQVMSVQLYAEGNATFSVSGSDGTVLKSAGVGASGWSGDLPSNQDYIITVIPVSGSTAFTLVVTVVF